MPNRTQSPPVKEISNIDIPAAETYTLDNGIPVKVINKGTQDILEIGSRFLCRKAF